MLRQEAHKFDGDERKWNWGAAALRPEDGQATEGKSGRKNIPERRNSKGDPSYPQKTKPTLPLKPAKIDSKGIKRINPKGQRRERGDNYSW